MSFISKIGIFNKSCLLQCWETYIVRVTVVMALSPPPLLSKTPSPSSGVGNQKQSCQVLALFVRKRVHYRYPGNPTAGWDVMHAQWQVQTIETKKKKRGNWEKTLWSRYLLNWDLRETLVKISKGKRTFQVEAEIREHGRDKMSVARCGPQCLLPFLLLICSLFT